MAAHVHLLCYAADQRELLGNAVFRVRIQGTHPIWSCLGNAVCRGLLSHSLSLSLSASLSLTHTHTHIAAALRLSPATFCL